jgi:hypothetical protein
VWQSHAKSDGYADSHTYSHAYSHGYGHANTDANSYTNWNSKHCTQTVSYATPTSYHAAAAPIGFSSQWSRFVLAGVVDPG